MTRTFLNLGAALAVLLAATIAQAAEPFSKAKFEAAQSAGKPVLIDINATWCPVCKAQGKIIAKLTAQPAYKDLIVLKVDFDSQKDVVRSFGARQQSTLIAFKGKQETARIAYDASEEAVTRVVKAAF